MARGKVGPLSSTSKVKNMNTKAENAGGVEVSTNAPTNTNRLWINSDGIVKYFDPETKTWRIPRSTFS